MQLNFLQEDILATLKESKPAVASKASSTSSPSLDLFGDLPPASAPEKAKKKSSEKHPEKTEKAEGAFKTISEASAILDVPQHVLRFWESRFTQIKPLKMGGGRRYYRPEDIDILSKIQNLLYKQGYTIKGAKKAFGIKSTQPIESKNLTITDKTVILTDKQRKQVLNIRQELINLRKALRPYLSDTISA
ncbi:MAG: MerR family transcriptional regulator [Rickettsiales bacterium]